MKPLDPNRYALAELVDSTHKLPMPNGRFFGVNTEMAGKENVDLFDPFVSMLIAGGSIKLVPKPKEAALEAPPASPAEAEASLESVGSRASS